MFGVKAPGDESSVAEFYRNEQVSPNFYYNWSKAFLDAGKQRLHGNSKREACPYPPPSPTA